MGTSEPIGAPVEGNPVPGMGAQPLPVPPIIPVDDFDVHEKHIEIHNAFRMSQEYEMLPEEIKNQFDIHVKQHEQLLMQKQISNFLEMIPQEGAPMDGAQGPGATMSGNGQVPDMTPTPGA